MNVNKLKALFAALLTIAGVSYSKEKSADDISFPEFKISALEKETIDLSAERQAKENYISPQSVYASNGNIYVADETGGRIFKLGENGVTIASASLVPPVNYIKEYGGKIYVLRGELDGEVVVFDENLKKSETVKVGHTPISAEFHENTAYIINRFSNSVSVVNTDELSVSAEIKVGREPISSEFVNGKLYVACHLTEDAANAEKTAASVYVVENGAAKRIPLVNGAGGVKEICRTPDDKYLFVTLIVARYQYPTTQLDGAWINSNGFAVLDAASGEYLTTFLLDDVTLGAASPWGIAMDGENAYFAISGTGEIITVPLSEIEDKIKTGTEYADQIGIFSDCRKRIPLSGEGVRSISYMNGKLYCGQFFSGDVAVLDVKDFSEKIISLGNQPKADSVRIGETLWYDATACYQNWESCASCHPYGRADGFNWDNLNDGIGNPKSATSMTFSHRAAPVMATGIRSSAEIAVRAGMKYIQFNTISEEANIAIDEFLKAQLPTESPSLNLDGTLNELAKEGEELFESYGCVKCHPAPLYTDLDFHPSPIVGNDGGWETRDFATPTLVEVWRSAPYMYNGSAPTLEEAIVNFVPKETPEDDINALAEFVRSIGIVGEEYGVEQLFSEKNGATALGRPEEDSIITGFTVRKQSKTSEPCFAVFTVTDSDGVQVYSKRFELGEIMYNTSVKLTVDDVKAPRGGKLTIRLENKDGNPIASDYVLKVKNSK